MKISYVWFDIGYTLLYMQREITYQQVLKEYGSEVSLEKLEKYFHLTDKLFMREYPGVFLKERGVYMPWFLGVLNHRLGLSLNVCEVDERWEKIQEKTLNYWLPFDGVFQVLEELKKNSIGMGIISNWDDSAQEILKNAKLHKYFEHQVISSEIGCTKPSAEIFKAAIDKAGVKARECLYVGDNYYDDAIGCRKVGMNPLIINRFGSLGVEEIKDCPIIPHIGEVLGYCRKTKERKIVRGRKNS
ncbi:hypothetical protein LCGC14_1585320 [marine sediment metagenome]|uniref:Uncharacterized protein n=1 Tax=marine sediment metagenome TaxID=412755 RepID=A0A0F9IFM7_9ZZZZ|nr:HAD family hydrolase [Desulfobacterales bacterium]